jgi:hypothetical protein
VYHGVLLGCAEVVGEDRKMGRKYTRPVRLLAQAPAEGQPADWAKAEPIPEGFAPQGQEGSRFEEVPTSLNSSAKIEALRKSFEQHLAGVKVTVPRNEKLNMSMSHDEDESAFRVRCQAEAWREFERRVAKDQETYAGEFARYRTAPPGITLPPAGSAWVSMWEGYLQGSPIRRTTPAAALPAKEQGHLQALEADWHREVARHAEDCKRIGEQCSSLALTTPKKGGITITHFGLAWVPFWIAADGAEVAAYRSV